LWDATANGLISDELKSVGLHEKRAVAVWRQRETKNPEARWKIAGTSAYIPTLSRPPAAEECRDPLIKYEIHKNYI
jgi:hypothetical protein